MSSTHPPAPTYRGSQKHKNRPTSERKGTLCPEWTHAAADEGYGSDPFKHPWQKTEAWRLFSTSSLEPDTQRRFATSGGIAFEAKPTRDGTWHGYPVPWESVPAHLVNRWIDQEEVTRRQIKEHWRKNQDDLHWAIEADRHD